MLGGLRRDTHWSILRPRSRNNTLPTSLYRRETGAFCPHRYRGSPPSSPIGITGCPCARRPDERRALGERWPGKLVDLDRGDSRRTCEHLKFRSSTSAARKGMYENRRTEAAFTRSMRPNTASCARAIEVRCAKAPAASSGETGVKSTSNPTITRVVPRARAWLRAVTGIDGVPGRITPHQAGIGQREREETEQRERTCAIGRQHVTRSPGLLAGVLRIPLYCAGRSVAEPRMLAVVSNPVRRFASSDPKWGWSKVRAG